jgi:exodeoxyribonuclease-3
MPMLIKHFGTEYPYIYTNNPTEKKGYSGTAILSKVKPINVFYNMDGVHKDQDLNDEGRIIRAEFKDFTLINVYTPNSKPHLERLEYRHHKWEPCFRDTISSHSKANHIIVCGDLNVAHEPIDLHSPRTNTHNAGYTEQERLSFGLLLHNLNLVDTFRHLHPNTVKYSWWSNFHNSRSKNKGWRIDYFLIDKWSINNISSADIFTDFYGSDHAPIVLALSDL